ncbi:uncharacterized protein LOC107421663 [Ziziphus jujuba]|uniref:Uncharacterized protein LOC107421663 n=1 Tax=Ziziphus jujuba TaxID=326968 RepID=A0A6P4AKP6_ZIZJJ|nr:uncharacterized protein LOC107421663 [Ziziphus jujuba]
MELELGLKITKTRHDLTSTAKFQLSKDPFGPFFTSRETETMFILTAHLKGYRRESIGIKINEDGTQISISGEKPVQEMVMIGWTMQKQEVELRGFIKVFQIPSGVVLDRIKAKFRDEESILTISMPKSTKGIRGVGIVEVKEEDVVDKGRPTKITKTASDDDHKVPERVETKEEQQEIHKVADKEEHVEATIPEKIEEPKNEKKAEHDQVDEGKLEPMEIETDKAEEIGQNVAESSKALETEHQTEKATPKADIEAPIEEPNGLETDQIQKQTRSESALVPGSIDTKQETQSEETEAVDGIHEDLQNQEAKKTSQADHNDVTEEAETSQPDNRADQKDKDEVKETDKSGNQTQEISEEKHDEGKEEIRENDSPEDGKKKDVIEVETRERKPGSRRRKKLCRPCAIAGSALLVSLVVIVINWIRSRKR